MSKRRHATVSTTGAGAVIALTALIGATVLAAQQPGAATLPLLLGAAAAGSVLLLWLILADQRRLFFLLLIVRAACDPLLDALRGDAAASSGGGSDGGGGGGMPAMGAGAALNVLMIMLAGWCVLRRPQRAWRWPLPAWAPFLATAAVSTVLAPELGTALRLFMVQLSYCAAFLMPFYLIRNDADLRRCLQALLWSSLLPVLAGLAQLAGVGGRDGDDEVGRIQGTFSHANIFAFYLLLIIAVILYLLKRRPAPGMPPPTRRAGPRLALWSYMALLLILLLSTKTRSAWLACWFLFVAYGTLHERRYLLYTLMAPAMLLLDAGVRERVLDLASNNDVAHTDSLNSYAWRVVLWKAGLGWMQTPHQVLGYGLNAFSFYSPQFFPLDATRNWDSHNVYVQLYFEMGVAGLASFGWLFWRVLRQLRRGASADPPGTTILMTMTLAYLIVAYGDNLMYYLAFNWYFWFFAGTACAALAAQARPARLPFSGVGLTIAAAPVVDPVGRARR